MKLSASARHNLAAGTVTVLVAGFFGFIYPFVFPPQPSPGFPLWHSHVNGILIGTLIGLALSFGEFYVFRTRIRRLQFSLFILVQTLYYLLAINLVMIAVMVSHYVAFHGMPVMELSPARIAELFRKEGGLTINAYALVMVLVISFIRSVSRMLGPRALVDQIIGKYHRPVQEERIFMFLDLKGSTAIAETIGHSRYHGFLNDFFYDITPAILETGGEIYQYVGDEVVVTWKGNRGLNNANCLHCFFAVRGAIGKAGDRYRRKYGFLPAFKAGLHIGTVTAGLIGDVRRALVFNGDTVNTAARIRSECTAAGRDLLLSGQLLDRLPLPGGFTPESIGRIRLRGKDEEIELHTIGAAGGDAARAV